MRTRTVYVYASCYLLHPSLFVLSVAAMNVIGFVCPGVICNCPLAYPSREGQAPAKLQNSIPPPTPIMSNWSGTIKCAIYSMQSSLLWQDRGERSARPASLTSSDLL